MCPFKQWIRNSGEASVKVTRVENVLELVLRLEDLDRTTQQIDASDHGTAELESGIPIPVAAGHSYNLFVSAVRASDSSLGKFQVDLELNGEQLLAGRQCECDGSQPSGHWTIVA